MSMFSTRNGLYEKARKQFKITDGIKLFTYSFYKQNRDSVQAFFAQIYSEAEASKVGGGGVQGVACRLSSPRSCIRGGFCVGLR